MPALSQGLEFIMYDSTATASVVFPQNTSTFVPLVFNSIRTQGDGYYGGSDGVHTVMYTYDSNFVGSITMQATLATEPTESDWFDIVDTTTIITENTPSYNTVNITISIDHYNFIGNFVWIRAKVGILSGQVRSILLNR